MNELIEQDAPSNDLLDPEIISPEGLSVAETYLSLGGDSKKTAVALDMPVEVVQQQLKRREVKAYVDQAFHETGFRNRTRLFGVLDQVINMKLEEMEDTGLGSQEDILTILEKAHKMQMATLKMEVEVAKAQQAVAPTTQTNVQINNSIPGSSDSNYSY